jgi:hypothetical protein
MTHERDGGLVAEASQELQLAFEAGAASGRRVTATMNDAASQAA